MDSMQRRVVLLYLMMGLGGCNIIGWVGHAVPKTVPAVYKLPKARTLILVDDPQRKLGDPALVSVIMARISFDLTDHEALKEVVPVWDVHRVAAKEGADFEQKSIASLAKELKAKQVLHVQIDEVQLEPSPGMVQPTARVYVKVIDAKGQRLFPSADAGGDASAWGYGLAVKLPQASAGVDPQAQSAALLRALATRIGQETAGLFYKRKVSPGSTDR